ncbi:MAG TPA: hypothetical protein VM266_07380 [Solirubrobacteraceae bacterium]|nr:hypothetical protein [Solirubrobacteraceae bacterium]
MQPAALHREAHGAAAGLHDPAVEYAHQGQADQGDRRPAGDLDHDDHLQPRQDLAESGGQHSQSGVRPDVGGEEAAAAEPLRVRRREAAEHEHHLEDAGHPDGRRPEREGDEEGGR